MVEKSSEEGEPPTVQIPVKESSSCNFECSDEIRELIGEEVFLLRCPVWRYNKYGWRNTRLLVLTQDSFIIMKQKSKTSKEIRLRNGYEDLKGATISLHRGS